MQNRYRIFISSLIVLLFVSCSSIAKLYLGVKNPKIYSTQKERLEYYGKLIETDNVVNYTIKTFNDVDSVSDAFKELEEYSFPFMLVQDLNTHKVYKIDCLEDVGYYVNYIKKSQIDSLPIAESRLINLVDSFMSEKRTETTLQMNDAQINDSKSFNFNYVTGIFMGNKLLKRVLPITTIDELNHLTIIDLSINKQ